MRPVSTQADDEPRLTVSADDLPLTAFCRWVADKTGVSIVVEDRLETRRVTLDVKDVAVSDVLGMVARRAGSQVTRVGRLYYVGELRPEDRGVLVRKVARLSGEELKAAVGVLLSEHGRAETFADGLLVVGDRVEVLQRLHELLDGVENAVTATWVVQLFVVNMTRGDVIDLGLDAVPALDVAAAVAGASGGAAPAALAATTNLKGGIDILLRASRERSTVGVMGQPLFLLVDGGDAHAGSGARVPVPMRAVSNQGTSTTSGYQYIDTGLQIDVELREVGHDRARIKVKGSYSTIQSFVDLAPLVSRDDFTSSAVVASGGVYLLNALERRDTEQRNKNLLTIGLKDSEKIQVVQVWARAFRVAGPASSGAAAARAAASSAAGEPTIEPLTVVVPEVEKMDQYDRALRR